ncbi:MAG: dihydrofolate reductase [Thermoanaerobaculia bacterium]
MRTRALLLALALTSVVVACAPQDQQSTAVPSTPEDFQYLTEQFADLRILRYQVPGFDELDLEKKKLLYYLHQAALSGRDIIYDQNYKHNLLVRRTLDAIVDSYTGDRSTEEFQSFMVYAKRVWFSNGIHHHYSKIKFLPEISPEYFAQLVKDSAPGDFPLAEGETLDDLIANLLPIVFDPEVDSKSVNLDASADLVADSANNYYEGLTQSQAEAYYAGVVDREDPTPISYGLNSKLVMTGDGPQERVWKVGGMYSEAIEQIVYWLEKAVSSAENETQAAALSKLAEYYKTGDLRLFDEYNILWVQDTESEIDAINGFIETYGDALSYRGAYESVISIRDVEATKRIQAIAEQAQWFEDQSPIADEHKREEVTGISAKVITVVVESGDSSPSSPIGINLPNANWIRSNYGSKSVTLGNLMESYNEGSKESGYLEEFAYSEDEIELGKLHGTLAANLHTDMHEVIGHASGKLEEGVGTPNETLKNYGDTLEEGRADLIALYYGMDPKLVEIGVMPSMEVGRVMYDNFIRNGLLWQLRRLELGENVEEAHMRNRQLVAKWVYEKGRDQNVIERVDEDGKTYFVIRDYEALRELFGQLLRESQRITSQGDFEAGRDLVETYGVKVDPELHAQVLERFEKLGIAPYGGFINPKLVPVMEGDEIVDVAIEYPDDFTEQMLHYGKEYSALPTYN